MTLAEWIDINVKENLYYIGNDIMIAGQKDGSFNTNDNVFEFMMSQGYAKEIFGSYSMMFFKPEKYDGIAIIKVFINIPTPEEMKKRK